MNWRRERIWCYSEWVEFSNYRIRHHLSRILTNNVLYAQKILINASLSHFPSHNSAVSLHVMVHSQFFTMVACTILVYKERLVCNFNLCVEYK